MLFMVEDMKNLVLTRMDIVSIIVSKDFVDLDQNIRKMVSTAIIVNMVSFLQ